MMSLLKNVLKRQEPTSIRFSKTDHITQETIKTFFSWSSSQQNHRWVH